MKKTIITLAAALLTLGMVSSCDLERLPKDSMEKETSLRSVQDLGYYVNNVMVKLRGRQGGIYEMVQDLQADQISITIAQPNHYPHSINWETVTADDYDRRDVWIGYYQLIDQVNTALLGVHNITPDAEEQEYFNNLLGTLYFARAYAYANLALRYGTPYDPASAGSDLCVPLILEPDYLGRPSRATNEVIYDQILNKDLSEAKRLLSARPGEQMSDEITLDACLALEARTRLYMSDWSGALASAKKLIDSGTYPLVTPSAENFTNMWLYDTSSEEILTSFVSRPDETTFINDYFGASTAATRKDGKTKGVNAVFYLPTQDLLDLYAENDLRKAVYFEQQECNIDDTFLETFYVISKRKGNPEYAATKNEAFTWWGGYVPNSMHNPKIFRIAEQYLIAAEAAFNLGQEGEALKYLNALRESRGLEASAATGTELRDLIRDERTRELAFEGFRLWDLRRWNLPVVRDNPQLLPGGGEDHLKITSWREYPAGDYRMVWPIPANDINTNENIAGQQNPGW